MQYDPIKRTLGKFFNLSPLLRIVFYKLLDCLLLRCWHIHKALRAWNDERGRRPADILDAGSGFGQYTHHMAYINRGNHITAVDVKQEQIDDCNAFFQKIGLGKRIRFEMADLTTFIRPEAYDLVLSVDVMEHIEQDEQVFRNFAQSLRKGGTLLISTPSDLGGSDADEHDHHHEGGAHGFIDEHVRDGYNIQDIEDKLRRAGFSHVEARYTYGKPGHISWLLSMKWPITMLNASKAFFILLPFYYVVAYPISFCLNFADIKGNHAAGTGLMVKAVK